MYDLKSIKLNCAKSICSVFLFLSMALLSGCASKTVKSEVVPQYSFYELCFYFERTPESTTEHDVADASSIYYEHLENRGITVFKRSNSDRSACFFVDRIPDFSKPARMSANNKSQYLLNAYFDEGSASLIGVEKEGERFDVIFANSSKRSFLPIYFQLEEGVSIRGNSPDLVFISRYLEVLDINHQFGINDKGVMIVNVPPDISQRWMIVPFLFESLNLPEFVLPKPGDYSILSECVKEVSEIAVLVPSWEKRETPSSDGNMISKVDSLLFSSSTLSLPFSEDVIVRYLYSLKGSHLFSSSPSLFYSPNFTGGVVNPKVYLISSELEVEGGAKMFSPEKLLLWILSVESEIKDYPDTLYANILSLKLARKLYTGTPQFLGGAELFNPTTAIPFESIRKYLFNRGNVSVFGSISNNLYLNSDEIILEYPSFGEIGKSKGFKAYFGSPDLSSEMVVSIVFRSPKALNLKNSISKMISNNGYLIIQTLFEQISENDSWGSVSFKIHEKNEKEFLALFEKKIKTKHRSISLGVYRVPE